MIHGSITAPVIPANPPNTTPIMSPFHTSEINNSQPLLAIRHSSANILQCVWFVKNKTENYRDALFRKLDSVSKKNYTRTIGLSCTYYLILPFDAG